MTILIIEDEKFSFLMHKKMLLSYFSEDDECQIDGPLTSIAEVEEYFEANDTPDLILSDIRLSDGLVFNALDRVNCNSRIIFLTAYSEYAIKSFQYHSVHYLLKPIEEKELMLALDKSMLYPKKNLSMLSELIGNNHAKKRFLVESKDTCYVVEVKDISYIHYNGNALIIHDFSGRSHILDLLIDECERQLDRKSFFRVNRQDIVNVDAIDRIVNLWDRRLKIYLKNNKEEIMVSRRRAKGFRRWLED